MIHPHEITIGSLIRTNKGEIIRVESISTKRKGIWNYDYVFIDANLYDDFKKAMEL